MSRKVRRVRFHLDPGGVKNLPLDEIRAILRGADDLIMRGGRSLLTKVLKGSRAREVLEAGLERSPVYGYYRPLSPDEVLARIDWVILSGFLKIEYDGRLPFLVYTPQGWDIERDTYASELLAGFDGMIAMGGQAFDMAYLKDKPRDLILLLLDKVEATGHKKYLPLLEAWERVDYKKVRQRIRQVITRFKPAAG